MGNDMFNDEQLAHAKVMSEPVITCRCPERHVFLGECVLALRLALETARRGTAYCGGGSVMSDRERTEDEVAIAEARATTLERAMLRLAAIREWAGGLGWLGSPQDERVEAEVLAILDGDHVELPDSDKRLAEARAIIRRIVENHCARITDKGILVYGAPMEDTGFVQAIRWLEQQETTNG